MNGQTLSAIPVSVMPGYTVWGADVTSFAGTSASLVFAAQIQYTQGFEVFVLDQIAYSSLPVPEPSTSALFGLAALLLGVRGWRLTYRKR